MKLYVLYFSPTGGAKKVIDILVSPWKCEKQYIDLSNKDYLDIAFADNDICAVAVPSFSGRVPQFIIPKLHNLHGAGIKTMLVAVYGNRAFDDTLLELKDTMEACGFVCSCAVAAVARHSVLPKYGKGRPDSVDMEQLAQFSVKCKEILEQSSSTVMVPGNRPYRKYVSIPIKPKANQQCINCGACYQKCPVHAIHSDDYRKCDTGKCISCLQCVAVCPQKARQLNPIIVKIAERKMRNLCSGRKANELFIPCEKT